MLAYFFTLQSTHRGAIFIEEEKEMPLVKYVPDSDHNQHLI